jgi:LmbE family N-acetylglucosaminyl deacetylase
VSEPVRRVLLLVPHPDDEVVGCALAIRRARARGTRIFALYLTTGVPPPASAWPWRRGEHPRRVRRRRAEAREAAARLGVEPLAFSDWPSRELKAHLEEARALVACHVDETAPQEIWAPAYEGGHQDHDVTNFLASLFRERASLVEFSEYNAAQGVRANHLPIERGAETVLWLTDAEASWKEDLVRVYRSERANLRHVRCVREVLRPLPSHDYRRPPHAGRLFYERFQWIPFRHPRVDFTSSATVCDAIARYSVVHSRSAAAGGSDDN